MQGLLFKDNLILTDVLMFWGEDCFARNLIKMSCSN